MSQELLIAASALTGVLVIAGAMLKGWQDWLALKSRELTLPESRASLADTATWVRHPARH